MTEFIKIETKNINNFVILLKNNKNDNNYFKKLGWSYNQFIKQINNNINFSIGLLKKNNAIGFILGNLIDVSNNLEYEILVLYIDKKYRKKGYASLLIKYISNLVFNKKLTKMTLEVAENNIAANNLYKKIKFYKVGVRKNYYKNFNEKNINAIIYEKIINE